MPNTVKVVETDQFREKLIDVCKQANDELRLRTGCSTWGDFADILIANGVTFQNRDIHWATEQAYKNGYEDGKPKWIPVTERLPKEGEDVLVFGYYHEAFQILICHYRTDFKGQWFTSVAGQQVYEITHWMPLPEPPKGE